jgi:molybdenum cofactor cytidylyltransferase
MWLFEALEVHPGEVVSFVGGGGKTTAMFRLGRELADLGWRVVTTTTTMIAPPELRPGEELVLTLDQAQAERQTRLAWEQGNLVTLATESVSAENKLKGIPPSWVHRLVSLADIVLVEADGARMRPFKAPAAHEPVVPDTTSLLIPVVGVDAVGRPLCEETVHRPELVSEITGLSLGAEVTTDTVAKLLTHPRGGLKNSPAHARVIPLINKAATAATFEKAGMIASAVLRHPAVDRVLTGSVADAVPVHECWRRVSAIVLAAGGSGRMGRIKQLLPVAGMPMLERIFRALAGTTVAEVIAVLGASAERIAPQIPSHCRTVLNPNWRSGLSTSLKAGLAASSPRSHAALFLLADQPLVSAALLERLLHAYYGTTQGIVAPRFRGQQGTPALFDRRLFPALELVSGDSGGREVIRALPEQIVWVDMDTPKELADIDTPEDYQKLNEQLQT